MEPDTQWMMVYRPTTLVFKTIHHDKAGETCGVHVEEAEIADIDEGSVALLVTQAGVPVCAPVSALFPVQDEGPAAKGQSYIGGHELTRIFHPTSGEARTARRWMSRVEVEALLNNAENEM